MSAITPVPEIVWADSDLEITRVVVGSLDNNVFIVRCAQTGESVLIDAANEHELLLDLCRRLDVRRVVETHGHFDHIGAVADLRDAGYSVAVTQSDAHMLPSYDEILDDDEVLAVGRLQLRTALTPGHTPGSVCFSVSGKPLVFTGDTLFPGGPGATHFPGGDFAAILTSIESRLFRPFAADTIVWPGHGTSTTVGAERGHLDEWAARGW